MKLRDIFCDGVNALRCSKNLSRHHPFLSFLLSPFVPCKNTFMNDYDGM
jgi:hypothetical protein